LLDGIEACELIATMEMSTQRKGSHNCGAYKQSIFFTIVAQFNQNMLIIQMKSTSGDFVLLKKMQTGSVAT
jgi:hypothetical protein